MGSSTIYVITSPNLIKSVQKLPKVLAFPPMAAQFAMTVCGSSKEANDVLKVNVRGDEGDWGYSMSFLKILHPSLAPGPALDAMNRVMIKNIEVSVQKLQTQTRAGLRINLVQWLRHEITIATTNSVYGPKNPFQDPMIEKAFWCVHCSSCGSRF